jgi:hypothetical protein
MNLGFNDPGQCLKGKPLRSDSLEYCKSGRATSTVTAHLSFTAVGVEKTPTKVHALGGLKENETVCPNGNFAGANPAHEIPQSVAV